MKNKMLVITGVTIFIASGFVVSFPPGERNLKVLPKDISDADLDSVMVQFEKALGVGCDFCHAKSKTNPDDPDFASDDIPEKEITRMMMKMTETINKDFFNYSITYKAGERMAVKCQTCHDGFARPELKLQRQE
jgi:hypothetical protein